MEAFTGGTGFGNYSRRRTNRVGHGAPLSVQRCTYRNTVASDSRTALSRRSPYLSIEISWDQSKRRANRKKHGVDVVDAARLLTRPLIVVPTAEKKRITIRLDEDIIEHFKRGGTGDQSRINAVLKAYVLAQQMNEAD